MKTSNRKSTFFVLFLLGLSAPAFAGPTGEVAGNDRSESQKPVISQRNDKVLSTARACILVNASAVTPEEPLKVFCEGELALRIEALAQPPQPPQRSDKAFAVKEWAAYRRILRDQRAARLSSAISTLSGHKFQLAPQERASATQMYTHSLMDLDEMLFLKGANSAR